MEDQPPRQSPPQPLAYSVDQVAALSSLGRTSIYALIKAGQLTSVKVGTRTLILRDVLQAFLARRSAATKSER